MERCTLQIIAVLVFTEVINGINQMSSGFFNISKEPLL